MGVGMQVKIPGIRPLATVVQTGRNAVRVDLLKDLLEVPGVGDYE